MVKLRYTLILVFVITASIQAFAGWRVVIDKNCLKIVASNTASQKLIEDKHNQRLYSYVFQNGWEFALIQKNNVNFIHGDTFRNGLLVGFKVPF